MTYERIEQTVGQLGRGIAEEAIVIGSSAVACVIPDFRRPGDVDIAVPAETFHYLQQQPGWSEAQSFDGTPRLLKSDLDVGIGWGISANYDNLRTRSWATPSGLHVSGLPDVYAYKHRRQQGRDAADLRAIQTYLHDPSRTPFCANQIPHEFAAALDCLSGELQDDPNAQRAALLAANGIHIVYTLYGHPEIGQANQIIGDLEQTQFNVPAMYHNGFGLLRDTQALQQHLYNSNAPLRDHLLALATDPYTDAVYGNGRFSDHPDGHDELRSADLLKGHALQLGFDPKDVARMHAATLATTFDEQLKSQRGRHAADPLARAVAGVDLHPLSQPESIEDTFALAIEDGFSARFNKARTIGRVVNQNGIRVCTLHDGLSAIDSYAGHKPSDAPDGPTVMQVFAQRLLGNAGFHREHRYPDGWTLDNLHLRNDHATALERISVDLLAGKSATEAYLVDVQEHTRLMKERYQNN